MERIKCLYCGYEGDFVEVKLANCLILFDSGSYEQAVKSYACTKCGYVQLFAKNQVEEYLKNIEKEKENQKVIQEYEEKTAKIKDEILKLSAIIEDENQTVKAVREAGDRKKLLENQLLELERCLSNYQNNYSKKVNKK